MQMSSRAWQWWIPLVALAAAWALAPACVDPVRYRYSCSDPADCAQIPGGGQYTCVGANPAEGRAGVCEQISQQDGGTDGGAEPHPCGPAEPRCLAAPAGSPRWCWDHPLSDGRTLYKVRGRAAGDVFAVGEDGVALYWDGTRWARCSVGTQQTLRAVWPGAEGRWWAGGDRGTLLRWSGSAWEPQALGSTAMVRDILELPDASVLVVGEQGTVHALEGAQWSPQPVDAGSPPVDIHAVAATTAGEVFVVGERGFIWERGASGWRPSTVVPPQQPDLMGVTGMGDDDALAVGADGGVLLWSRSRSSWNSVPHDVGVIPRLNDVWYDSNGTWAVGAPPHVQWNVQSQSGRDREFTGSQQQLYSVWSQGESVWAVGFAGTLLQRGSDRWVEIAGGMTRTIRGLGGLGDNELWAVGDRRLIMRRGRDGRWAHFEPAPPAVDQTLAFTSIWVSDNLIVVAASNGTLYEYNRQEDRWSGAIDPAPASQGSLHALWGVSENELWVVGENGLIARRSNNAWTPEQTNSGSTSDLNAIWGSSASNIWVVGNAGTVLHYNGSLWSLKAPISGVNLFGVWTWESGRVWVVGNNSSVFYSTNTGSTWVRPPGFSNVPVLRAVAGRDENSLWLAGEQGTLLQRTGSRIPLGGYTGSFQALWVAPSAIWLAGENGAILKLQ